MKFDKCPFCDITYNLVGDRSSLLIHVYDQHLRWQRDRYCWCGEFLHGPVDLELHLAKQRQTLQGHFLLHTIGRL